MKKNNKQNFRVVDPRDFLIEQINADAYFENTGKFPQDLDESFKSWLSGKWNQAKQAGKNVGNWAANAAGAVGNSAIDAYNRYQDNKFNKQEQRKASKDAAMRKQKADQAREFGQLAGGDWVDRANAMGDAIEANAYQAQTRKTAPSNKFKTNREIGSIEKAGRAGAAPVLAQQILDLMDQLDAQAPSLSGLNKGSLKQCRNMLAKIASGEMGVNDQAPQQQQPAPQQQQQQAPQQPDQAAQQQDQAPAETKDALNDSYNPHINSRGQRLMLESFRRKY